MRFAITERLRETSRFIAVCRMDRRYTNFLLNPIALKTLSKAQG